MRALSRISSLFHQKAGLIIIHASNMSGFSRNAWAVKRPPRECLPMIRKGCARYRLSINIRNQLGFKKRQECGAACAIVRAVDFRGREIAHSVDALYPYQFDWRHVARTCQHFGTANCVPEVLHAIQYVENRIPGIAVLVAVGKGNYDDSIFTQNSGRKCELSRYGDITGFLRQKRCGPNRSQHQSHRLGRGPNVCGWCHDAMPFCSS